CAGLVLAWARPAGHAFAQGTNGALQGKVTDAQGLVLSGVTITVRNAATGFQRSATSESTGGYRLAGLPVGAYEVRVEQPGFSPETIDKVEVNVAATTSLDVELRVAAQNEELTVSAAAPLIDTRDSGVGEVVSAVQIENLPLNGRQFGNLAALVPGVSLGFHTDPGKASQF